MIGSTTGPLRRLVLNKIAREYAVAMLSARRRVAIDENRREGFDGAIHSQLDSFYPGEIVVIPPLLERLYRRQLRRTDVALQVDIDVLVDQAFPVQFVPRLQVAIEDRSVSFAECRTCPSMRLRPSAF